MTFEEIFKEEGLYRADSFVKGACFEVKFVDHLGDKFLFMRTYKNENDVNPDVCDVKVYSGLFEKSYEKVFTRQSLFK